MGFPVDNLEDGTGDTHLLHRPEQDQASFHRRPTARRYHEIDICPRWRLIRTQQATGLGMGHDSIWVYIEMMLFRSGGEEIGFFGDIGEGKGQERDGFC